MKNYLQALIFLLTASVFVTLATAAQAQFSGGIRAGINGATEQYTGYEHETLALPYAGLYAQYQVNQIGFQIGVNYSAEGTNLKDLSTGDTYHDRQTYLTIPLLIQGHFDFGGYIELGAQYGFLLASNESYNGGASVDTRQDYTSTDFAVGGGIGYEFNHTAKNGLGINLRYMRGLTSIINSEFGGDAKTRVLSVGLNYRF